MLNQRGQAFSVFELMIAGVVAFAILIILLTVINGIIIDPSGNAKDQIGTTLKQVVNGGSANTKNFSIDKDTQIIASDVAAKATIEADSVFFYAGTLEGKNGLKVDVTPGSNGVPGVSYVSWTGAQPLKAKAKVVCGGTADLAVQALEILDTAKYNIDTGAISDYCKQASPCCAIILDTPSTS